MNFKKKIIKTKIKRYSIACNNICSITFSFHIRKTIYSSLFRAVKAKHQLLCATEKCFAISFVGFLLLGMKYLKIPISSAKLSLFLALLRVTCRLNYLCF